MKDRKKPEKFLLPHGMPSDDREFAFSSKVPSKALKIKAPYKSWHYQIICAIDVRLVALPEHRLRATDVASGLRAIGSAVERTRVYLVDILSNLGDILFQDAPSCLICYAEDRLWA
jgi:hypothetical protein